MSEKVKIVDKYPAYNKVTGCYIGYIIERDNGTATYISKDVKRKLHSTFLQSTKSRLLNSN